MPLTFFPHFKIISLDNVKSTNDFAMQRLKNNEAQNGDIIVAKFQDNGRGQFDNSWFSSPGNNLLVSIICKDIQINASQLPLLNMLVSLAVYNVLNNFFSDKTTIKWPNDILVDEQKMAGILIETTLAGQRVKNAIIGIGVNINEEIFPANLPNACSFFTLNKKYQDIDLVLKMVLEQVDMQLCKLDQSKLTQIINDYESVLFGMGVKRYFRTAEKSFTGIIKGITNEGQLLVEVENKIKTFNHKEIAFDFSNN